MHPALGKKRTVSLTLSLHDRWVSPLRRLNRGNIDVHLDQSLHAEVSSHAVQSAALESDERLSSQILTYGLFYIAYIQAHNSILPVYRQARSAVAGVNSSGTGIYRHRKDRAI